MKCDVIGRDSHEEDSVKFFTIGDLIDVAKKYSGMRFVFLGEEYTVGDLGSWRGSYDLPSIEYDPLPAKFGGDVAQELEDAVKDVHLGYKGGEYVFHRSDIFYVSARGRCEEYKVFGYKIEGAQVVLLTKKDPY